MSLSVCIGDQRPFGMDGDHRLLTSALGNLVGNVRVARCSCRG